MFKYVWLFLKAAVRCEVVTEYGKDKKFKFRLVDTVTIKYLKGLAD